LKTQTSHDIEGGVRIKSGPFEMQSSIYNMDLENEIHFIPALFYNVNLDPTRRYGSETSASLRVGDSVTLRGGVAYTRAIFREGQFTGHDVPLVSRYTASGGVTWNIWQKYLVADATVRGWSERFMDNDQANTQRRTPASATIDFRLSGEYERFFWSLGVNNVLNALYYDYAVASTCRRQFSAIVRWTYGEGRRDVLSRDSVLGKKARQDTDWSLGSDSIRAEAQAGPDFARAGLPRSHIAIFSRPGVPGGYRAMTAATIDLLQGAIADPDTQWSLGTFGAIAEFSRDRDEPVALRQADDIVSAVTSRGGIVIKYHPRNRPLASEGVTRTGWNQRIALCLADSDCAMGRRAVLTELGADRDALREQDRESILFDLGLGAPHADFCVRIDDRDTAARLRQYAGRAVFEPGNPAMGLILAANPHRVFISRLGRIEVYQPIPHATGKSPEGPHTHVLPRLLRSGRTHPATEPIPTGWIPCAHLYPPHPARDGLGEARPFDAARHDSFQRMIERFGIPGNLAIKRRVADAIDANEPPSAPAHDRHGRTTIRIALRQMKAAGHLSPALQSWVENFDPAGLETDADEADLHHDC
jgi:hypothetical protein